jgi:hypothetical protein
MVELPFSSRLSFEMRVRGSLLKVHERPKACRVWVYRWTALTVCRPRSAPHYLPTAGGARALAPLLVVGVSGRRQKKATHGHDRQANGEGAAAAVLAHGRTDNYRPSLHGAVTCAGGPGRWPLRASIPIDCARR